MDKYKLTFKTWDKVASLYEEAFMDMDIYDETYDLFCAGLQTDSSVLEIGCGPGNCTKYIISKLPKLHIEGIDVSLNMVEIAQKNIPSASFKVMDARDIDQINKSYDAIFCGFCIPYFSQDDYQKFIHDCSNLMKSNGQIYLSFVEGNYSDSGIITGNTGDQMYFYYHELDRVLLVLKNCGFQIDKIIHVPYPKKDKTDEVHTVVLASRDM